MYLRIHIYISFFLSFVYIYITFLHVKVRNSVFASRHVANGNVCYVRHATINTGRAMSFVMLIRDSCFRRQIRKDAKNILQQIKISYWKKLYANVFTGCVTHLVGENLPFCLL